MIRGLTVGCVWVMVLGLDTICAFVSSENTYGRIILIKGTLEMVDD